MAWSLTPERRDQPELMDEPGLPDAEVADAYRVLRFINRRLGNLRSLRRELERSLRDDPFEDGARISLLDVGSGSGDVPAALAEWLARRGVAVTPVALDRDPMAAFLAAKGGVAVVRGDALRLPFPERSIDLVTAVKFAHHFRGEGLARLVSELTRVARRRVVVLDIRRHWVAYWGFVAWSLAMTRNRLVRHDGPVSVLRGFTPDELSLLAAGSPAFSWEIRSYAGFQLALVGRRVEKHYGG